ncbi:MAG: hypothetical protein JO355_05040 [Planctomycetaceae bacterium]|jgi:hypothetical protein|nr:hypothetical protein [Planctomycetaceae bacterium]MBV8676520.1 hypothetical protein [Planctomycetaceae bacterium]
MLTQVDPRYNNSCEEITLPMEHEMPAAHFAAELLAIFGARIAMEQRTFEGTWEEITRRGSELAGRKVRVTVLNEPVSPVMLDRALAHLIADAEQLVGTLPPVTAAPAADAWSEGVIAKYRRQGFTL